MGDGSAARRPRLALAVTMTAQALGSLCLAVPAVVAPVVAPLLGFGPERVGLFVGIAYLAAMLAGLASGQGVTRFGPVAVTQSALLAFAIGMTVIPSGIGAVLVGTALLLGIGYGQLNPSAAFLLNQHSPPAHRGLFFSLKQSAVPLGVALAGLLMPPALGALGWQTTMRLLALVCAACFVLLFLARRPLEPAPPSSASIPLPASSPPAASSTRPASTAPSATASPDRSRRVVAFNRWALVRVLKDPHLRLVSLASFAYAFSQLAFMTFLVSYLHLELGWSLASAAAVLAGSQAVATVARIGWGAVADRWIAPDRLLGWLGVGSALALLGLGAVGALAAGGGLRLAPALVASLACALTTMSWNGVFFAELARRTTHATLASYAGAAQFLTFCGSMAGPVVFGELLRFGSSYAFAYGLVTVLPLAAGAALLRASRAASPAAR
jgi:predicted MFS family arabinose efflux permease